MLNKQSQQYFKRAVCLSGTPLSYFAEDVTNNHTDLVIQIAEQNGQNISNTVELLDYLSNVTPEEIFVNGPHIPQNGRTLDVPWAPIVEG